MNETEIQNAKTIAQLNVLYNKFSKSYINFIIKNSEDMLSQNRIKPTQLEIIDATRYFHIFDLLEAREQEILKQIRANN